MAQLKLYLLGHFQAEFAPKVDSDEQIAIRFPTHKSQALLAYLAVEAKWTHSRDELAGLFWPEQSQQSALTNLRSALASLRKSIGDQVAKPPFLLCTRESIQINPRSDYYLDVADFMEKLSPASLPSTQFLNHPSSNQSPTSYIKSLESAVTRYRGPFLDGFPDLGSTPFEEWVLLTREQLQRQVLSALRILADDYEEHGEYDLALPYAWRQIDLEPWQEEAHRQLMRIYALSGQRSQALAQYQKCQSILSKELGVEPSLETARLYQQIKAGEAIEIPLSRRQEIAELRSAGPPAPFVARQGEISQLDQFLKKMLKGQGQVAFVVGEAGSGKSALLTEFTQRSLRSSPTLVVASGRCNAYTGIGDPYLPFLEILRMLTGDLESRLMPDNLGREHARRLYALFPEVVQSIVDQGPALIDRFVSGKALLSRLRTIHYQQTNSLERILESREAETSGVSIQQSDLFEQYTEVLQNIAHRHPLLLLIDDLQWADDASLSLLFHLGRHLANHRILIVGAYRSAEVALGRGGARHPLESIVLEFQRNFGENPVDLDQAEGKEFINALLDSESNALDQAFRDTLYHHTHGHPLFTIELLQGLQERGDLTRDHSGCWIEGVSLDWDHLPPRVEAVIAERIARLPETWQRMLSIASVEGEEFSAEVVAQVWRASVTSSSVNTLDLGTDGEQIFQILSGPLGRQHRLIFAQGIQRIGSVVLSRYRFQHFLFQKYLFHHLDIVERSRLHQSVGESIEVLFAGQIRESAIQLAWHFEEAGLTAKSIAYLLQAADRCVELSANLEAIAYFRHALELLKGLPDGPQKYGQELQLQMKMAVPLVASRGYSDPLVEETYDRASQLCRQLGNIPQLVPALQGLGSYYSLKCNYIQTREIYKQIQAIAQGTADPDLEMVSNWQMGYLSVATGQFLPARKYLELALVAYDPQKYDPHLFFQDPGVSILTWLARALWALGYPDQSLHRNQQALALAEERQHPFSLAFAYCMSANLYHFRQEEQETLQKAEAAIQISARYGFPIWIAFGQALRGWALVILNQSKQGLEEIRQGIEMLGAIGAQQPLIGSLTILAEALELFGQVEEAMQIVSQGLSLEIASCGEFNIPIFFHRRGSLLLHMIQDADGQSNTTTLLQMEEEAQRCFLDAVQVAQRQDAKSWELRATLSLYRLLEHQGRLEEASQILSQVYSWFTEGFDTHDLTETRLLLQNVF